MKSDDADADGRTGGRGSLVPVKTVLETRRREDIIEVFVMAVPVKGASGTLSLIRKLVPDDGGMDTQHLRRFSKVGDVPEHVRETFFTASRAAGMIADGDVQSLLLIIGPVSAISPEDLREALSITVSDLVVFTANVPLLAPTSQDQARAWTVKYWPTVYKKSNPFGPHPSIVSRAEEEMMVDVRKWMDLADEVAGRAEEAGIGERFGIVIVARKAGRPKVVAVAGDARWKAWDMNRSRTGPGNVTAHAIMRAIGMVAGALKSRDEETRGSSSSVSSVANAGDGIGGEMRSSCNMGWNSIDTLSRPITFGTRDRHSFDGAGDPCESSSKPAELPTDQIQDVNTTLPDSDGYFPAQSEATIEAHNGSHDLIAIGYQGSIKRDVALSPRLTTEISRQLHEDSTVLVAAHSTAHSMSRSEMHRMASVPDKEQDGLSRLMARSVDVQGQDNSDIFQDLPFLKIEKELFDPDGNQNGYLCHDLEIYCTHEPCIMCSMALVHSRFGRVVFQQRMEATGGLCADNDLGHGLAWRKELNWTLLAWQWQRAGSSDDERKGGCGDIHA